ncbi:MAG TPA: cytochrome c oxidase assembly protein [Acidimicrobiales bacterium]|nr:cytochrome c oxidase assembly protein [Acidimicrobiales bacterium]
MLALTGPGLHPVPLAALAVGAAWYANRVGRVRSRGGAWPLLRTGFFAAALVTVGVGSVAALPGFTGRAVQDLLLFLVAPPLLVLSGPLTLGLEAGGKGAATARRAVTGRVARVVLHPVSAWVLYGTALLALYFTPEYRVGAAHPAVRLLIDLELVAVGWLFAYPLAGPDPKPRPLGAGWRIVAVMFGTIYFSILGMAMQSQRSPIAPGVTPAAMHAGGGDLWSSAELLTIAATIGILYEWLFVDLGRARRADQVNAAEDARQLALWRASRREAGLADVRARESVIVRSRPSGTERAEAAFAAARPAPAEVLADPALPAGEGGERPAGDPGER